MNEIDWVYGLHAIDALLRHNHDSIRHLYVLQGRRDERIEAVLTRAQRLKIAVSELSRAELDQKADGVHQGVVAECKPLNLERSEGFLKQLLDGLDHPPFLLVLDGVTDPHNLGACMR